MNAKIKKQILSAISAISKSAGVKSVFRVFMLASYCVLICAAILFSFKSVFNSFFGIDTVNSNNSNDLLKNPSESGTDYASVLSKVGSRGENVAEVQNALKNLGYYLGGVDGIFGVKTQDAVMRFQKARGLPADGIVGSQTLKALGLQVDALSANSENDFNLLARLISAEAKGEPYIGQVAVGAVILNRIKNPSFPNSIAGVIYQPGAFSCIGDGQFNEPVSESAYRAARDALNGIDPVGGALYYYNPKTASKSVNQSMRPHPVVAAIGGYVFCS